MDSRRSCSQSRSHSRGPSPPATMKSRLSSKRSRASTKDCLKGSSSRTPLPKVIPDAQRSGIRASQGERFYSALPGHANQILVLAVADLEVALEGVVHRLADAARHVGVGGGDLQAEGDVLDLHDALQGMLGLLALFLPLDELEDLVAVRLEELTLEHDVAPGEFVLGPLARRAHLQVGIGRRAAPRPASIEEARAARRTARRLGRLRSRPVRIVAMRRRLTPEVASGIAAFVLHGAALSPRSFGFCFTWPRCRSTVSVS